MFISLIEYDVKLITDAAMQTETTGSQRQPDSTLDGLLAALRAAAEPTRLRIVALLAQGELTVSELVRTLGQSQPRISRHLKLLTEAGLLTRHREGSWAFHRLADDGPGAEVARHLNALLPDMGNENGAGNGDQVLAQDLERLSDVKRARADAAAAYFRDNAESWDKLRSLHVDEAEVEKAIGDLLPKGGIENLLDLGAGTGRILELLCPRARRGTGIDLSREMLAVARDNLERAGCDHCQVRQGDLYQLPFATGAFDVITIHQVLHFLDEPGRAVTEAARVLAPGGCLLIADFAPHALESLRDDHNHRRLGFDSDEIKAWLNRAGLTLKDTVSLAGDPLTVVLWLAQKPQTKPQKATEPAP
jgi:ArsR family transcriptional regulator